MRLRVLAVRVRSDIRTLGNSSELDSMDASLRGCRVIRLRFAAINWARIW